MPNGKILYLDLIIYSSELAGIEKCSNESAWNLRV